MNIIILILLGLCFGSFVNAWVYRLHEQEIAKDKPPKTKPKNPPKNKDLSILHGRSMCVNCHHTLAWYDLLPILSWISLRGNCRYCHKSISWQYPLVEIFTAGLFVVSYLNWPYQNVSLSALFFGMWLVFLVCFMALTVYDLRWLILPDRIVFGLIGLSAVHLLIRIAMSDAPMNVILGGLTGFLAIGGLFWVLFQVSDGKWIGGGDVKLGFMIGLLLGSATKSFLVIFIASLLGTLISLPLLVNKSIKATTKIPFGQFLLIATIVVYLFGQRLIDWYLAVFL